jgi:hypothetical protein
LVAVTTRSRLAVTASLRIFALAAATILVITCLYPARLQADGFQALVLDANYAKPVRWNVGGSLALSHDDAKASEGGTAIVVGGSVGRGGMRVWGGTAQPPYGDFRAVVTRTWDSPRGASANSTYVGGEVGFGLYGRFTVGYAKRISGPSTGGDHIVTGGVGLQIPVWFRESQAKHVVSRR